MKLQLTQKIIFCLLISISIVCNADDYDNRLTLGEAEHIALKNSSELKQIQANANSLEQQAVADGQLSDPQFIAGAINVPTNSFSFTQDDMTMVQVGLQQSFPAGHSLAMKSKKTRALAKAQWQKIREQAAMTLRNVRETWLDIYYWDQASLILNKNKAIYRRLLKTTESQYSVGKIKQSDVLQLQVELTRLKDQSFQIEQRQDVLRAQLGRWLGQDQASRPISTYIPNWPEPPSLQVLQNRLMQHPLLRVDTANIEAARHEVAYAKEQFKPAWMLGIDYGFRQGRMMDGTKRSNMLTAEVTVDLPIFPGNRQSKRLCASVYELDATRLERDIHYKDLSKELSAQYAIWQSLAKRQSLYRNHLSLEAKQNSKSALLAYQNATTDLSIVLRAYSNELTIRLEEIQIQVELVKARAALLYLEGVTS